MIKKSLLGAIRRVSIFSNKSTHQVALSLSKNNCFITTEDPEKSSKAKEKILGDYLGDDLTIGYNAEYLKDIVSHVAGQNIEIKLNTPVSAALFEENPKRENIKSLMLLMPIGLMINIKNLVYFWPYQNSQFFHLETTKKKEIVFSEGITVIWGENGSGKTSLLEAIYILSLGKSFKTHKQSTIIKQGCSNYIIKGDFSSNNLKNNIAIQTDIKNKKNYQN